MVHPGKIVFFLFMTYHFGFIIGLFWGYVCGTIIDRIIGMWRKKQEENLLFHILGRLARADDGHISEAEIKRVEGIFLMLGIESGERRERAKNHFRRGSDPEFDLEHRINRFLKTGAPIMQRTSLVEKLIIFALVERNGWYGLSRPYRNILETVVEQLQLSRNSFEAMVTILSAQANFNRFNEGFHGGYDNPLDGGYGYSEEPYFSPYDGGRGRSSLKIAYQALGAEESDSDETVKKKYRKLINKYHPDKFISRGMPKDEINLANEKTQQIRNAYEQIKKNRGIR